MVKFRLTSFFRPIYNNHLPNILTCLALSWWSIHSVWPLVWSNAWDNYHMRTGFADWISFLSSVAGFAETSTWPTTYSTVALTCHGRNFLRHHRSDTFQETITICAAAVFVCSRGKQPSPWDFPFRIKNSRWKWSILPRLTLSSDCWTKHGLPCSSIVLRIPTVPWLTFQ